MADYAEQRRIALEAFELGKVLMAPKPTRLVPSSRLSHDESMARIRERYSAAIELLGKL